MNSDHGGALGPRETSTSDDSDRPARTTIAWALALGSATVVGTLAMACMTPFVALAVLAAATMPRGRAVLTVAGVWGINQSLGFTLEGYPPTPSAFAWGGALGVAAMLVVLAAGVMTERRRLSALRTLGAFVVGFALYEGLLFGFAQVAGGLDTFSPSIVALIARNEAEWLAGLFGVFLLLTSRAPRRFGAMPALRLA